MGVISGFASAIPVRYEEGGGFDMSKTVTEAVTQDFLCLLQSDGKIWDTDFGAGLGRFLFEHPDLIDHGEITSIINEQVRTYLDNYLSIINISYLTTEQDPSISPQALVIQISARCKTTGAPIPVSVTLEGSTGVVSAESIATTFTGNPHNWYLTER